MEKQNKTKQPNKQKTQTGTFSGEHKRNGNPSYNQPLG